MNGLRLYVEATRAWAEEADFDRLPDVQRAVRFSATSAKESWGPPMVFPVRDYRWRSSNYYRHRYYHRGEDLGAMPERFDVLAGLGGTVEHSPRSEGAAGANPLVVATPYGVSLRYLHMNTASVPPALTNGASVEAGERVGQTGQYWNGPLGLDDDPHLHVDLRDERTKYSPYPALVEAYLGTFSDSALPNGGGNYFAVVGDTVLLDATRTVVRPGRKLTSLTWTLHDGRVLQQTVIPVVFEKPGLYIEELTIQTDDGFTDKDFAYVRVYEPAAHWPLVRGYAFYAPQRRVTTTTPVDFWIYVHNAEYAMLDFGDGTPSVRVPAREGTAAHTYFKPGLYVASVRAPGSIVVAKTRVDVDSTRR